MVSLGTMALEEGGRVDFKQLRSDRRSRVLAAMEDFDLDMLVIGREANARYITGTRRLWQAGTKSFTPGCLLIRATNEVYLLNNSDDGVPVEIPHDHLFGRKWDPLRLVDVFRGLGGFGDVRRIGVDAMSPRWRQLLGDTAPQAVFLDAQSMMRDIRMHKTDLEVFCVRVAVAVAEAALSAASQAISAGRTERDLLGVFLERMTDYGITTPSLEGNFCAIDRQVDTSAPDLRRFIGDGVIASGDLVALRGGVLYAGYEGSVARTWPCVKDGSVSDEQRDLYRRWNAVWRRLSDVCHPGATGADLRAAYEATGEPLPAFPIAYSTGLGFEAPIAGSSLGPTFDARWRLDPGMVLGIEAFVGGAEGGYLGLETVLITQSGHEVLSTLGHGPLARDT